MPETVMVIILCSIVPKWNRRRFSPLSNVEEGFVHGHWIVRAI